VKQIKRAAGATPTALYKYFLDKIAGHDKRDSTFPANYIKSFSQHERNHQKQPGMILFLNNSAAESNENTEKSGRMGKFLPMLLI
jgi:hypothetical protein